MTIKELKAQLSNMDDSCMVTMQKPDGTQVDISRASQDGNKLTFYMDR